MGKILTIQDKKEYQTALETASDVIKRGGILAIRLIQYTVSQLPFRTKQPSHGCIKLKNAVRINPSQSFWETRHRQSWLRRIFLTKPGVWRQFTGRVP